MNVAIIGMPGSMKSSVGRLLAPMLGYAFVDTDDEIERAEGKKIKEIFAESGEEYFRDLESSQIEQVFSRDGQVVSLGGGAPLREKNAEIISSAFVVLLTADAKTLLTRTVGGDRPLLHGSLKEIEDMMQVRKPHYESVANYMIDTTALTSDEVAEIIKKEISK